MHDFRISEVKAGAFYPLEPADVRYHYGRKGSTKNYLRLTDLYRAGRCLLSAATILTFARQCQRRDRRRRYWRCSESSLYRPELKSLVMPAEGADALMAPVAAIGRDVAGRAWTLEPWASQHRVAFNLGQITQGRIAHLVGTSVA